MELARRLGCGQAFCEGSPAKRCQSDRQRAEAKEACPGNKGKVWGPKCSNTNLLIVSDDQKQLEDRNGAIGMHKDKGGWQKWTMSPAGDGYVSTTPRAAPSGARGRRGTKHPRGIPGT